MDINSLMGNLREWYPGVSFRMDGTRLFVNNMKICVVCDNINDHINPNVVDFIKAQVKELITDTPPQQTATTIINIPTIGNLKIALQNFSDDMMIIGNCVDMFDNWYNYPCYIAKVPGDNKMVTIQLKPIDEKQITDSINNFRKEAEKIAYMVYKKTGVDFQAQIVEEIMKLINK